MSEYQVPRLLWEVFEAKLLAQARIFIKDAAKILEVDEKALQRRILPSGDKLKVYLHDTQSHSLQCQVLVPSGSVLRYCRSPVAIGHTVCPYHRTNPQQMNTLGLQEVELLMCADGQQFWLKKDKTVIDSLGNRVGVFDPETEVLKKFVVQGV